MIADLARIRLDRFPEISQGLVIVVNLHFYRSALFIGAGISRVNFYRFGQIVQCILEPLIVGVGIGALLISNGQILRVFSIDFGGFAKTLDSFIPILILGSL